MLFAVFMTHNKHSSIATQISSFCWAPLLLLSKLTFIWLKCQKETEFLWRKSTSSVISLPRNGLNLLNGILISWTSRKNLPIKWPKICKVEAIKEIKEVFPVDKVSVEEIIKAVLVVTKVLVETKAVSTMERTKEASEIRALDLLRWTNRKSILIKVSHQWTTTTAHNTINQVKSSLLTIATKNHANFHHGKKWWRQLKITTINWTSIPTSIQKSIKEVSTNLLQFIILSPHPKNNRITIVPL